MKQILLTHKIKLIVLSVLVLIVSLISLIKVDYTLTAPGYNNNVNKFIEFESSYESEGSFHTTSVIVLRKMTFLQKLLSEYVDTVEVDEIPDYYDDIDISDLTVSGFLQKDDSIANSLVVGLSNAGYDIKYTENRVVFMTYNFLQEDTLEIGDVLLTIDGEEVTNDFPTFDCNTTHTFEVLRDGETLSFDITNKLQEDRCLFGFQTFYLTEIQSSEVEYTISNDLTFGPSGGLMQSLYVFNSVTPNDITGGLKIAGTGTISVNGNVGSIGGIEQKIITSALNGIDVFFAPHLSDDAHDNYLRAVATLETLESDMIIIPVTTFQDALNYLEGRFGGAFDE